MLDCLKPYQDLGFTEGSYPVAERYAKQALILPLGPQLAIGNAEKTVDAIKHFFN